MSEPSGPPQQPPAPFDPYRRAPDEEPQKSVNLVLLYSLIAVALASAIGFALMIVYPFHHRHLP
jgi:hypothetical protein